ncbi:MAG TPA: adenosylcobinamide-GDP ribazoletransferase [Symbiobacteriaceae bacterium]|nr:adenosylcobinamide-GDP ribazoletransferase [Symbiobacteriaceae bacterium]
MRAAVGFLTRFPVGRQDLPDYFAVLGRQAPLFPVVGALVGAGTLAADAGAGLLFGPAVRSAAAVAAGVWITGALHLDGLMDTADGVGSHRSRERMLEIMKDSRVGAMGVVAGVLSLLLRFALLLEVPAQLRWQALLLAPALGRMMLAASAGLFPPAQPGGIGAAFAAHVGRRRALGAMAVGLVLAAILAQTRGGAAWAVALAAGLLAARALSRKLGGLTGDTYGAVGEVAEVGALACFAAGLP